MLTLTGGNSYGGATTVNGGTLQVGNVSAIPSGPGMGDVTVHSPGVLDVAGNVTYVNGLSGNGKVDDSVGGGALLVGNNANTTTFSGTIQNSNSAAGVLSVTILSGASLTLSGTNSYLGGTTVNGTLIATNVNAIADGTNLSVGDPNLLTLLSAPVVPSPVVAATTAIAPVPEPGTLALLAAVMGSAIVYRRLRRK
jgi:autotransporter-associated beta strand protein